jgi:protein TonB
LVAVGVFHVLLVYALVNGLARKIVEVVRPPLETKIIEEVKQPRQEQPPAPPPPKLLTPPPPFIPPPEVQVQVPVQPPPTITAVVPTPPAVPVPPPAVSGPARTPAVVDARGCPAPSYPPASERAKETGIVTLNFLINVDGKVLESKVERSSGYRRLDEAARAGLAICRFTPATVDGRPERAWSRIEYEWKMD